MTGSGGTLLERQASLLRQSADARAQLAERLEALGGKAGGIDRGFQQARTLSHARLPVALGAGFDFLLEHSRTLRLAVGAVALAASIARLRRKKPDSS